MTRQAALQRAITAFEDGSFKANLQRRIQRPTESQNPARAAELPAYLQEEIQPALEAMGFECRLLAHPKAKAPFLFAQRTEGAQLPTVLGYGHGDVIRGLETEWREGVTPWDLTELEGHGMAAVLPITRANTRSTCKPWPVFWQSEGTWASMPNSSSKWAKRRAHLA